MFRSTSGFGISVSREFAGNRNLAEIDGSLSAV